MTNVYMRLEKAPGLGHPGYPTCEACCIETEHEDGNWHCPSCGTSWPADNMEHDPEMATLYEVWSGEILTGQTVPNDDAWRFAGYDDPQERENAIAEWMEGQ